MDREGDSFRMIICLHSERKRPFVASLLLQTNVPENGGAIVVVFRTVLDETESIHVADQRFAFGT